MSCCSELLLSLPLEVAKSNSPFSGVVQIIIPFSRGILFKKDIQHLAVGPSFEQFFASEFLCVAEWLDGSIQQLKLVCLITSDFGLCNLLNLYRLTDGQSVRQAKEIAETKTASEQPLLSLENMSSFLNLPASASSQLVEQSYFNSDLLSVSSLKYNYQVGLPYPIEVSFELTQAPLIKAGQLKVVIRNPNRAQHENGLWDLGDKNSLLFRSFLVSLPLEGIKELKVVDAKLKNELKVSQNSFRIVQHASGGENWNSPNHVNSDNVIPFHQNGFVINIEDQEKGPSTICGSRCVPELYDGQLYYRPLKFWQNFPAGLSCEQGTVSFEFFPDVGYLHELQPGEQKTFLIDFGSFPSNTFHVRYPLNYLAETGLLPTTFHSDQEDPLRALIASGSFGPNNFLRKREIIDEYGWRNFGDIWADHETENYQGDELFISHYNNQYDPLYGFLRQYLIDGNSEWFELADDLAKHIIDIDIYHTLHDRPEYNGGMFWHTDHFCKAVTATHRTYSRFQEQGIYDGHAGGGGPGGQHCYTTGLLLYYFLTGNSQALAALTEVTNWITNYYEGCGGFLEGLLSIKQSRTGLKDYLKEQYPLDRGTANYIVALIDSYLAKHEQLYLDRAGEVLKRTISHQDDIESRKLHDVESCWFYVVLLQAAGRFIDLKRTLGQLDNSFHSVKLSLVKYAEYMLQNEYPYLQKPEILEFPNHTWTGQDLRKAVVFAYASMFATSDMEKYQEKAWEFYYYVVNTLSKEPSTSYTRIQALLMLNSGFSFYLQNIWENTPSKYEINSPILTASPLTQSKQIFLFKRFLKISFHNELNWCRHRFKFIDHILKRFT